MTKFKVLLGLFVLSILDAVIPLPLLGLLLLYVIFNRPLWFWRVLLDIYQGGPKSEDVEKNGQ